MVRRWAEQAALICFDADSRPPRPVRAITVAATRSAGPEAKPLRCSSLLSVVLMVGRRAFSVSRKSCRRSHSSAVTMNNLPVEHTHHHYSAGRSAR